MDFWLWLSERDEMLQVVLIVVGILAFVGFFGLFIWLSPGGAAFAAVTMLALWVHHRWVEYKQERAAQIDREAGE